MIDAPAKTLDRLFAEHPREIGETYSEHASHAGYIGTRMLLAGLACLVHAVVPGLFIRTASNTVDGIIELMAKRTAHSPDSSAAVPAVMLENPSN
jgi:hypothetical protein